MDGQQFDRLARGLARGASRRQVVAAALAAAVAVPGAASAARKAKGVGPEAATPVCPGACKPCAPVAVGPSRNISKCDLTGADLRGRRLTSLQAQGTCLSGANLADANLAGANLDRACLAGANLEGANLAGVSFGRVSLAEANLIGANLVNANLTTADVTGADVCGANLKGARLTPAQLQSLDGLGCCGTVLPNGKPGSTCRAGTACQSYSPFMQHYFGLPSTKGCLATTGQACRGYYSCVDGPCGPERTCTAYVPQHPCASDTCAAGNEEHIYVDMAFADCKVDDDCRFGPCENGVCTDVIGKGFVLYCSETAEGEEVGSLLGLFDTYECRATSDCADLVDFDSYSLRCVAIGSPSICSEAYGEGVAGVCVPSFPPCLAGECPVGRVCDRGYCVPDLNAAAMTRRIAARASTAKGRTAAFMPPGAPGRVRRRTG